MTKISTGIDTISVMNQANQADTKRLEKQALKGEKQVDDAASGFEALLLHNMLQEMFKTTGSGGLFGENSNESQIFRDMFHQSIADEISAGDGIGVKQFLKKELTKYETVASNKETGVK